MPRHLNDDVMNKLVGMWLAGKLPSWARGKSSPRGRALLSNEGKGEFQLPQKLMTKTKWTAKGGIAVG